MLQRKLNQGRGWGGGCFLQSDKRRPLHKLIFEWRSKEMKEHVGYTEEVFQAKGILSAEALRWEYGWYVLGATETMSGME